MTERHLERSIEWEPMSRPLELEHIAIPVPPFFPGVHAISIERDDNFHLRLVAHGRLTDPAHFKRQHDESRLVLPGTFLPATEVTLDAYGSKLALDMHLDPEPTSLAWSQPETTFEQLGTPYVIQRTWAHKFDLGDGTKAPRLVPLGEPAWMSEWYINGSTSLRFPGLTSRRRAAAFRRERDFQRIGVDEGPTGAKSWDHVVVDAGGFRFAFCRVPEEQAPERTRAVSIDYLPPFPDAETRAAVGEIVSFVLGRRMMRMGSTSFDGSGWTIEESAVNPRGSNVRVLCGGPGHAPVPYGDDAEALAHVLAQLVPNYLRDRERLGLRDALWNYWIAKESSASIDLPIFAAGVETLKRKWLASSESQSRGLHMPKAEFDAIAENVITQLRSRLPGEVLKNLAGANRMSLGAQMRAFFDEIGLRIGAHEKAAMDARHRAAHGASAGAELEELVRLGNAYRTLFDRVFLRLLGYDGHYIDRTTEGWPERSLVDPAGGA